VGGFVETGSPGSFPHKIRTKERNSGKQTNSLFKFLEAMHTPVVMSRGKKPQQQENTPRKKRQRQKNGHSAVIRPANATEKQLVLVYSTPPIIASSDTSTKPPPLDSDSRELHGVRCNPFSVVSPEFGDKHRPAT
jgi:hypothetical protein